MGMGEKLKHILSSRQFDLEFLIKLYKDTVVIMDLMKTRDGRELLTHVLPGYVMGEMFWQESSRTYHSFAAAAVRLGMSAPPSERGVKKTRSENGKKITKWELVFSSETKDAFFEDEICAWASCYDALTLRTAEEGLVARAAAVCDEFGYDTHVINAGDGKGEHPSQTLLDLFSMLYGFNLDIEKNWYRIGDYSIAFINDPKNSRTIHSLSLLLGRIFSKVKQIFISPPGLEMPRKILEELEKFGCAFKETHEFCEADVYYMTRLQGEYFTSASTFEKYKSYFSATKQVADQYKVKFVLHPFPRSKRGNELPIWLSSKPETHIISLDKDPRALYFLQMKMGVPIRMALLKYLLNYYLDLGRLKEERLMRRIKSQCVVCLRIEYNEVGWTENPPKDGYLRWLPHIICEACQPKQNPA